MREEVLPNLYRIEIPLPKNPLKAINSYVIKGPERNLIIDTGMNREEFMKAMMGAVSCLTKMVATGEAIAHLKYLEGEGKVRKETRQGKLVYTLDT